MSDLKLNIKPFLKWAGGKRQLLPHIHKYFPSEFNHYFEPFIGAGALFLDIQPKIATINDINSELVNCYLTIKNDFESLISALSKYHDSFFSLNTYEEQKEYFLSIRNLDRDKTIFSSISNAERAARIIFLNKTCFNGLYRVNSKGEFNVPFGKYKNPNILDLNNLSNLHEFLNNIDVRITNVDFSEVVSNAEKGDFIYFDPPYDPLTPTSAFTSYSKDGFSNFDQERLARLFKELSDKGCYVMLSNSATDFIKGLYSEFNIHIIDANRAINSNGEKRGKVQEVLITNY